MKKQIEDIKQRLVSTQTRARYIDEDWGQPICGRKLSAHRTWAPQSWGPTLSQLVPKYSHGPFAQYAAKLSPLC